MLSRAQSQQLRGHDGPSREWRKTIPLIAKRRHEKSVDSVGLSVTDQMRWTTCVECIDDSKFIFVGSGAKQNNLFVLENTATNKLTSPPDYVPSKDSLVIRSAFTLPNPTYHLSVCGTHLATAGPEGCIQIYNIDRQSLEQKGRGLMHSSEITLGETSLSQLRISPPGISLGTVRVNHVEFCGSSKTPEKVIATQGRRLYMADVATSQVLASETLGVDTVYKASFSPHPPSGSLICTGGTDKLLAIIDSRILGKSASMNGLRFPNAHRSTIKDTKFNQFIPYWVASASEDGVVKVWDIRYLSGPAARIDGHYGEVNSLCWSTTHCDIITTGSADRYWKAWSLSSAQLTSREPGSNFCVSCPGSEWEGPSPTVYETDDVVFGARLLAEYQADEGGPIVAIAASTNHADAFYSVSGMGEVVCHTIRADVFEDICINKFSDPFAKDVEVAIQSRDLASAFSRVINISRTQRKDGKLLAQNENELINLCTIRPALKADSWSRAKPNSNDSVLAMKTAFKKDLEEYSYCIPPRFDEFQEWTKEIPSVLRLEYDLVILRAKIVHDIMNGNWKNILRIEDTICECMELSNQFLDPPTLLALVDTLFANNMAKSYNLAYKLHRIVSEDAKNSMADFVGSWSLLVFPTMFEDESWLLNGFLSVVDAASAKKLATLRYEHLNKLHQQRKEDREKVTSKQDSSPKVSPMDKSPKKKNLDSPTESVSSPAKNTAVDAQSKRKAAIVDSLSLVRSGNSILSLELKMVQLIESFSNNPEGRDLDQEIIGALQKWDFNTGTVPRKPQMSSGNTNSNTGVSGMVTPYEKTISFLTNRLYLDALLRKNRFEEFFGTHVDLSMNFEGIAASKILLKSMEQDGISKLKIYTESRTTEAAKFLSYAHHDWHISAKSLESFTSLVKMLREAICLLVRITAVMMRALESKTKTDLRQSIGRSLTVMSGQMSTLVATLLKTFESLENGSKNGTKKESIRDLMAQPTHDALREANRSLPLSTERRPTTQSEKILTGYAIHEEAFGLVDRLFRVYLKADA